MYVLGIDLGTTYTAAAVWREGRAEICPLGTRSAAVPSVVLVRADGSVLTGEAAVRRAFAEPDRVAREFKRSIGDTIPRLLGGSPFPAENLTAKLLAAVMKTVVDREGGLPTRVCLSHPANWGPYKTDLLRQAVTMADLHVPVTFATEPEAAAVAYARQERLSPGETVAVYDLGGGTFDAAVLRRTDTGFAILGQPEGIERLGGIDIDAAVFAHVARTLGEALADLDEDDPNAVAAMARLRAECTEAKEALSSDVDTTIPVLLPNLTTEVRLTRAELEAMIRPSLYDSIEALNRALRSADVTAEDLASVLLVGGSSRIPLIAQLVGSELGRPVAVDTHPKHAIATGAAWLASGAALPTEPAPATTVVTVYPPATALRGPEGRAPATMAVTGTPGRTPPPGVVPVPPTPMPGHLQAPRPPQGQPPRMPTPMPGSMPGSMPPRMPTSMPQRSVQPPTGTPPPGTPPPGHGYPDGRAYPGGRPPQAPGYPPPTGGRPPTGGQPLTGIPPRTGGQPVTGGQPRTGGQPYPQPSAYPQPHPAGGRGPGLPPPTPTGRPFTAPTARVPAALPDLPTPTPPPAPHSGRNRWLLPVAAATVALLLVVLVAAWQLGRRDDAGGSPDPTGALASSVAPTAAAAAAPAPSTPATTSAAGGAAATGAAGTSAQNVTLTVTISGTGRVSGAVSCSSGSCSGKVPAGRTVTLTASATSPFVFTGWSGCASTSGATCTVTPRRSTTVRASFAEAVNPIGTLTDAPPISEAPASPTPAPPASGTPTPETSRPPTSSASVPPPTTSSNPAPTPPTTS